PRASRDSASTRYTTKASTTTAPSPPSSGPHRTILIRTLDDPTPAPLAPNRSRIGRPQFPCSGRSGKLHVERRMHPEGINLVVSCAKRKRLPVPDACGLAALPEAASLDRRAELWVERLRAHASSRLPASELYLGDHWGVVRAAARLGHAVRVWVCS